MWTSSNGYAFLAILARYVTNDWKLGTLRYWSGIAYAILSLSLLSSEEVLIDFKELKGEHSGDNMADSVWETIKLYEIQEKVQACIQSML